MFFNHITADSVFIPLSEAGYLDQAPDAAFYPGFLYKNGNAVVFRKLRGKRRGLFRRKEEQFEVIPLRIDWADRQFVRVRAKNVPLPAEFHERLSGVINGLGYLGKTGMSFVQEAPQLSQRYREFLDASRGGRGTHLTWPGFGISS